MKRNSKKRFRKQRRKRNNTWWTWLILFFLLLLLAGILTASYFTNTYTKLNIQGLSNNVFSSDYTNDFLGENSGKNELTRAESFDGTEDFDSPSDSVGSYPEGNEPETSYVRNILLIGVDNDYLGSMNDRGNADGLIILSINQKTKQIIMTSLMRDIDVTLADGVHTKLTLSYHFYGIEGLVNAIERNLNLPVDNYVLVNYLSIIDIVNAFGGITVNVTADELFWMQEKIINLSSLAGEVASDNLISTESEGTLTLNGIQTAAYMRIRFAGNGDYERTERIRKVLTQLKEKAMHMSIRDLNKLTDVVLPCIQTDFSQADVLSLLMNSVRYLKYDIISERIPIEGSYYETSEPDGSEVIVDFALNAGYLHGLIYDGIPR